MAGTAVVLQLISLFFCCVSGAFLQYDGTRLNGSPPNVTLTVGRRERVYCLQTTGPVPTAIEWYNPQGQLVSRDVGDEVNQRGFGSTAALLNFQSYQLSQGGRYECRVTGPGNYLEKLSVCIGPTNCGGCGCVVGVRVTPSVQSTSPTLTVTWQAVAGEAVNYTVKYSTQPGGVNTPPEGALEVKGISGTSTILTALERGTTYYIWVVGVSEGGERPHSDRMSGVTYDIPASVPQASFMVTPTVTGGRSSLSVQWRPPSSDLPVLRYTVTVKASSSVRGKGRKETTNSTSLTVENLTIGTTYTISVKARSAVGFGAELRRMVNTLDVHSPDGVSSYPLPQPGTVRVTWTQALNSTHGLTLMGYSVQYREEGEGRYQSQQVTDTPSLGELETFELEGLEMGTTYEIRVAMVTTSGVGKYSDVINVTTYADCCSKCSSIQSTVFVSFEVAEMKVDESDTLVHIDVFRYGPMSAPITLRVTDIPLTAKRVQDYSLQSSSLVFLNTERMVERSTVVVRIREDSAPEQYPPTESFRLVLSSNAGGGMQPAVVFSVPEMEVHIRDNDY